MKMFDLCGIKPRLLLAVTKVTKSNRSDILRIATLKYMKYL